MTWQPCWTHRASVPAMVNSWSSGWAWILMAMPGMYSFSFIAGGKLARNTVIGGGIFLLVLQFPFFLGIKLGLLAFFFFAFVFTTSVAHSCFSLVIRSGG